MQHYGCCSFSYKYVFIFLGFHLLLLPLSFPMSLPTSVSFLYCNSGSISYVFHYSLFPMTLTGLQLLTQQELKQ